jgi:hypothetical protein
MKLMTTVAAVALTAAAASSALAAPPTGKGNKPPASGQDCKPAVAVILRGPLTANGSAAPFTLSLTVKSGNHIAQAYVKASQPVPISVTAQTKINRQGDKNPADLKSTDVAMVQAKVCKADLANGATPTLTATRVTAHPASS